MDWFNLEDLLRKATVPEVAKQLGIELKPEGATFLALCPFHADTRPSLYLFPADGKHQSHFHCFACNAHGNAIRLVKEVQGVGFEAAVHWLAKTFGVQPERRSKGGSGRPTAHAKNLDAKTFVEQVFTKGHQAGPFAEWATQRGYSPDFLFELGLRLVAGNLLVNALRGLPLNDQLPLADELETMGLLVRLRLPPKESKISHHLPFEEQFRDVLFDRRVAIPIRSADGQIKGYAGRLLGEGQNERVPKYLLTRGLQKAKYLFNADQAFDSLKRESKAGVTEHTLYITEGFFDAIRLRSLGQAAVALMGTSLSSEHIKSLTTFAAEGMPSGHFLTVRIFLDRDAAGLRASARAVRQLLPIHGVGLQWMGNSVDRLTHTGLREGKDPDEYLNHPELTASTVRAALDALVTSAIAPLVLEELGSQNPGDLDDPHWAQLNYFHRDRALFNTAKSLQRVSGWSISLRNI